jgi:DNA-binding GntR family transcriptional regulator
MNIKVNRAENSLETQATRLFRALEFEIVCGKLPPGTRLTRRSVCKRFNVSQATVSEALWRLESEGLAESAPLYGTRVSPMTLDRVRDETILREALECEVARLVSQRLPDVPRAHLTEVGARVDALMRQANSYDHIGMSTHLEFHVALARLSGSALLAREVERIWKRHLVFFNWHSAQMLPVPERWHGRLLDAIFTGDADTAEKNMREHVCYGNAQQVEVLHQLEAAFSAETA